MSIKMLLCLHLNVWHYKCMNIPIYFYMSMIYRCLCVCEWLHAPWQNLSLSKSYPYFPRKNNAAALLQKTVSVCLLSGGYWRDVQLLGICNHLTPHLFFGTCFILSPATDECLHTHKHTCTCMRVQLMIVYPINCLYFGERSLRMRRVSVNSSTGM